MASEDLQRFFEDIAPSIKVSPLAGDVAFDEAIYLRFNPDIALAVKRGEFLSGYQHYLEFGQREGRVFQAPTAARHNQFVFAGNAAPAKDEAAPRVHLEVLMLSPHGVFLNGWAADSDCPIERLHLRGSGWSFWLGADLLARVRRHDVEAALETGLAHAYGFWSFVASHQEIPPGECKVTVFFANGTSSEQHSAVLRRHDADLLNIVLGYLAASHHYGNAHVSAIGTIEGGIGRHIIEFNKAISRGIVRTAHVERFHVRSRPPKASIVVCLYGKPEFLFVQACLYHRCPGIEDYEFIYVSNSPDIIERLLAEARIASRIYGIDQTCVLLTGNAGFGAANNIAAQYARSDRILIVNPDVFPRDPDWAIKHTDLLAEAPPARTRLFGVPLYYDDGSLMHGGMYFDMDRPVLARSGSIASKRLLRVEHYGKGAPPEDPVFTRARPVGAVTGAFISVERAWFERLGGFTEDYVFGHYEDADLCLKSAAQGVSPWLQDIQMWHLEGKGSTRLAMHDGASLVNRWLFSECWADKVEARHVLGPANVQNVLAEHAKRAKSPGPALPVLIAEDRGREREHASDATAPARIRAADATPMRRAQAPRKFARAER